jgi:hypothetical protein
MVHGPRDSLLEYTADRIRDKKSTSSHEMTEIYNRIGMLTKNERITRIAFSNILEDSNGVE